MSCQLQAASLKTRSSRPGARSRKLEAGSSKLFLEIERHRHLHQPRRDDGGRRQPRRVRLTQWETGDGALVEHVIDVETDICSSARVLEDLSQTEVELVQPIVILSLRRYQRHRRRLRQRG